MEFPRHMRGFAVALILGASLLASACGSDDEDQAAETAPQPAAQQEEQAEATGDAAPAFEHIHGLGAAEGTLYVATHNGLFRVPRGSRKPELVGNTRKDVMGFSVISADRFVGSGHPGPGEDLPPNLGLIESRDGGKTWKSLSLSGEADFHVLRSAGEIVYGFDGAQGFTVSPNGGRTWRKRQTPAAMFDLAVDPQDRDRLVAATEAGLFASSNGGKAWRPVNQQLAGLLAWPERGTLFLVDQTGQLQRSSDGGRSFAPAGSVGGQPAAFTAQRGDLYVGLSDSTVRRSTDGGASWTVRAAP
jgi:hypothetical protein